MDAAKRSKSTQRYLSTLKQIRFWVKPEEYELMQKKAEEQGYDSMRKFFLDAIYEKMKLVRDISGKDDDQDDGEGID